MGAALWILGGFLLGFGMVQAENTGNTVLEEKSPYGTFTPVSDHIYGNREKTLKSGEAQQILKDYYLPKGLRIGTLSQRGEFFETDVFRGNTRVDRVIIHRVTGRIRSLY